MKTVNFKGNRDINKMIGFEFFFGIVIGFLGFALYDVLKCFLWMKRLVIHVERCPETKFVVERKSAACNEETQESLPDEEECDDFDDVIAKVRKTKRRRRSKPSQPEKMDPLFSELKTLSSELYKGFAEDGALSISKLFTRPDGTKMRGCSSMLESLSKGEQPSSEDIKQMREEFSEAMQSFFAGEMTEEEKEKERKDSEIIMDRLQKLNIES